MPNTNSITFPTKSINTDTHQLNTDAQVSTFVLNGVISDRFPGNEFLLQNEGSNTCAVVFPPNYQVVGFKEIPNLKRVIYFLTNPITGMGQIGEVRNCTYTEATDTIVKTKCKDCPEYVGEEQPPYETREESCYCEYSMIISSDCFNFNVNYPVDIEYKITNCSLNLYFTDFYNERRFIYFDFKDNDITKELVMQNDFKVATPVLINCTCPEGYTYDELSGECIRRTVVPIENPGTPLLTCTATDIVYGNFGVALYTSFATNGTGSYTTMFGADTFWSNPSSNTTDGRLNYSGIWPCDGGGLPQGSPMLPINENVGFMFPLTVTTPKTYYVGVAGDNKVRVRVDCNTVLDIDPTALDTQFGGTGNAFKYWSIYPITLSAGRHIIELTGVNFGSVAGFGAEIYDNTQAEIIAATGGTGLNVIFSTHDKRGALIQYSDTIIGTCPNGTCPDVDDNGDPICVTVDILEADCECKEFDYQELLDCEKMKFHPNMDEPCIEFVKLTNGGNIKAGTYQVLVAYADIFSNPITSYFASTGIIPVFENAITFETNYDTNKAIKLKISNLKNDSLFKYYNIVIAKTIDNFTEFILVGTFSTSQKEYTYTGFEKSIKRLAPTEVLFKRPFYEKARGVTKANNYLFFIGAKEYDNLNLQRVANNITLNWQTVALKEKAYFEPENTFYFRTYMRDEVYAMGAVFVFDNGRESCVFHIPGRPSIESDLEEVAGNDVIQEIDCLPDVRNKRWQVYNTATVTGSPHEYDDECTRDKCWEYGTFAYWESTETYPRIPEIWGDLCGKPIRHHKFPDSCVTHIHDGKDDAKGFKENNYIFPIGVKLDITSVNTALTQAVTDGIITQEQRDRIVGIRIVRGNRVGNKSIDAKGLLYNMWNYSKNGETYFYPNYPYNDLNDDYFIAPDDSTYDGSTTSPATPSEFDDNHYRFTFHSPDVHFVNTALGNILKVETEEYGESEGYFTHSECQARQKFLSTAARAIALGFGVAAALSATGEKECKTVEYKSNYHNVDFPVARTLSTITPFAHTQTPPPVSDTPPVGGTFSPIVLAAGSGTYGIDTGFYQTWFKRTHNNALNTNYDPDTGIGIPDPDTAGMQKTTCKGQPHQLINLNPIVNGILAFAGAGLGIVIQKTILGLIEAGKILDTLKTLAPYKNYSIQYNSVGKYNNYKCVAANNKVRKIEKYAYLNPVIQNIDEPSANPSSAFDTIKVNNWNRESSVYLKIPTSLPLAATTNPDSSRVTMDQQFAGSAYDSLDQIFYRDIASYYVAVKRNVLNQYGQLCDIEYLETSSCVFKLTDTLTPCKYTVFGGDTFITRFALKRKMPFFIHTMCGLNDGMDVLYEELGNVGFPNYYFNTERPFFERVGDLDISFSNLGSLLQDIVGTNETRLDAKTTKFFYQNGYAHMFSYGVPYFLVESEINVDYRHGQNNKEKDFYPHNTDLKNWLEEELVPIKEDNYYFYNRTYSKQNKEHALCTSCILNPKDLTCTLDSLNRLIYSEPAEVEDKNDNWLIFKANSRYNFLPIYGKLISADGIENDKVLVRLENSTQIFNAYNTLQTTEENIQVGTGGMFQTRPVHLATTDLGYAGSQHRDVLHTEFGHIWADAERGQVFNLGTNAASIDEITKDGQRNWFKENLPFQIIKDFTNMDVEDIDNNLNGLGLHFCFDKRFSRILLTKLDYKKVGDVYYNKDTKTFYAYDDDKQLINVALTDTKYFCDKSWTQSYSFFTKSWTSYHSYIPNYYTEGIHTFDSGYKSSGKTYTHNATNKSYQVFGGKLYPFIVELQPNQSYTNSMLTDIMFSNDVIRYHNEFDAFYSRTKTFNKAIIYNNYQTTGLLNLIVSDPEDLTQNETYPKRVSDGHEVLVTNSEGNWHLNTFFDVAANQLNNIPIFTYDCNNVNKSLNPKALKYDKADLDKQRLRQPMCKVRLINDKESQYKYIVKVGQINQIQSIR